MRKKILFFISLIFLSSCASTPEPAPLSYSRVFKAKFEEVWRACQQALIKYPMRINNMDTAVLQTEYIKGRRAFRPPTKQGEYPSSYRYRLQIRLVRGNLNPQEEAIKVTIAKDAEAKKDFFSDPKKLESDGLEENVILYRIEREIQIERVLQKVQKKMNNSR